MGSQGTVDVLRGMKSFSNGDIQCEMLCWVGIEQTNHNHTTKNIRRVGREAPTHSFEEPTGRISDDSPNSIAYPIAPSVQLHDWAWPTTGP